MIHRGRELFRIHNGTAVPMNKAVRSASIRSPKRTFDPNKWQAQPSLSLIIHLNPRLQTRTLQTHRNSTCRNSTAGWHESPLEPRQTTKGPEFPNTPAALTTFPGLFLVSWTSRCKSERGRIMRPVRHATASCTQNHGSTCAPCEKHSLAQMC